MARDNGGGIDKLVKPDGTPIKPEPKLVVIKTPRGVTINPQVISAVAQTTGCNVIVLPMDSELIMGRLALAELQSAHAGIHAILELGPIEEPK